MLMTPARSASSSPSAAKSSGTAMVIVECNRLVRRAADIQHARVGQAEVGGKRRSGGWGYGKDLRLTATVCGGKLRT